MITPGVLRGLTQPTIVLRMTAAVPPAPGDMDGTGSYHGDTPALVFNPGMLVFAVYVGNGRLILTPIDSESVHSPHVVMASALNATAEIVSGRDIVQAFNRKT